ncbi:MAG: hybrid sensor histidine kinase/response regulator [Deltaproteobacteria bacterium]|nr:hybrid sensor histidine kinase/response regulator [Deltaproteobacteria bacterium]
MIDDSPEDAELLVRHLKREGFAIEHARVDSRESLLAAVADRTWDVIVCDYSMPKLDPLGALAILREQGLDVPFIIVSGMVGEEKAVACMRAGAHDFVLKDNLTRLAPAVRRELEDAATRRKLRASEAALAQSMKLRALGQMAAGVAHDLKNILQPLVLNLHVAERALDRGKSESAKEAVSAAREVARRGIETVDRLREYGREDRVSPEERVDLDQMAREALTLARARMTSCGRVSHVHEELTHPPPVVGRANEIVSALVNLLVNSVDAIPSSGNITVRSGSDSDGVWVEIEDDGPGITPDVEKHIFEPFFTTKGEQGTGLGLPMVYACMERHGGRVSLKTAPGAGTTFRLTFRPHPSGELPGKPSPA